MRCVWLHVVVHGREFTRYTKAPFVVTMYRNPATSLFA